MNLDILDVVIFLSVLSSTLIVLIIVVISFNVFILKNKDNYFSNVFRYNIKIADAIYNGFIIKDDPIKEYYSVLKASKLYCVAHKNRHSVFSYFDNKDNYVIESMDVRRYITNSETSSYRIINLDTDEILVFYFFKDDYLYYNKVIYGYSKTKDCIKTRYNLTPHLTKKLKKLVRSKDDDTEYYEHFCNNIKHI